MSDEKIKAATQEILEVVRKYDLSIYFCLVGRNLAEIRYRFANWSCLEQVPTPGGSEVRFRTRKDGNGERRPKKDIEDSANIVRCFADNIPTAAVSSIMLWKELEEKLGAHKLYDEERGGPPPWDLK